MGVIVGSGWTARLDPARPLFVGVLSLGLGCALFAFVLGLPASTPMIAVAGFHCGITEGLIEVLWITALQQRLTPTAPARVSAYDTVGSFVFMPVGFALAGPAADAFGTAEVLFACAACAVVSSIFVATLPSVRGFRTLAPAPAGR